MMHMSHLMKEMWVDTVTFAGLVHSMAGKNDRRGRASDLLPMSGCIARKDVAKLCLNRTDTNDGYTRIIKIGIRANGDSGARLIYLTV